MVLSVNLLSFCTNSYIVTKNNFYKLGYNIMLTITRAVSRDTYGRSLITSITNFVETTPINGLIYSYDAINRVITRNDDSFGYNTKSEVTFANISNSIHILYL